MKVLMIGGLDAPSFHGHVNVPYYLSGPLSRHCGLRHLPLPRQYLHANPPEAPHVVSRAPRLRDPLAMVRAVPHALRDVGAHVRSRHVAWATWYLVDAALVSRELRRGPDIVHVQTDEFRSLPILREVIRHKVPFVVTVHLPYGLDDTVRRTFDLDLQGGLLRKVQDAGGHLVCVSASNRDRMIEAYGLRPEQMHVIRNGCRVPDALPGPRRERLTLLHVGSLNDRKNHRAVLEAMAGLRPEERDFDYWIVGVGWTEEPLKGMVHDLGLTENVRFWGQVDQDTLDTLYGQAHAFVLPSLSEGFALVMLDALAAGLPVVAFDDLDGVRELGQGDVTVTAERDPAALGQAIVGALHRDWDRAAIQDVARYYS